jgi:hypothetical protein
METAKKIESGKYPYMHVKFLRKVLVSLAVLLTSLSAWADPADSLFTIAGDSVFNIQPVEGYIMPFDEPADVLYDGLLSPIDSNDPIQRKIDLARTLIAKAKEMGNFIDRIDEATKVELPVALSRNIGGVTYDIVIHAIRLKPAYAEIDVFMQIDVPQGQTLTFMAEGIKFTKNGGIVGDAKLQLLGDYGINFNGNKIQLLLKGASSDQGTYAVMDCDGFREIALDAEVTFSRDLIRPENSSGKVTDGHVKANFKTILTNWNDLVVQVSLPPFQVTGLTGVGFSVSDVVFDFSDVRNAPAVVFPPDYNSTQFLPDNPNLWRGFYMRQMVVSLPPEFQTKNAARTSFRAENVLIDNMGITGKFSGDAIIPLKEGNMNGWAFSLDHVYIDLQANQLVEAGFNGDIVIPIGAEDKPFDYTAVINTGGNYLFNVSPSEDMTFPLWGAGKVDIYESSYLDVKIQDGKFLPKASLSGRMSIAAKLSEGGQGAELANITFESLEIQSVKPYIKVGYFSFGSEAAQQKMAGFPISIQDIGLRSLSDTEVGLDFTLKLNLVGESSGSFAADAGLTLVGRIDADKGLQSWRYKDIRVNEIGVDIDGGAFKINGRLIFYRNDAMYGDGFNGKVKAEFTPGLKVTATAIFGNVTGMRYWYADALVNFPAGIPIFTGVGIYGFGGGAYYAMKMDNQGVGSELGRTSSGVTYVPDTKAGLGLKAIVSLASHPKPEAFNADVTFEISFFKGGGVRHIAFGGNGYLVTPGLDVNLDKLKGATSKMAGVVKNLESKMSTATMGLVKGDGNANSMTQIFGEIGDKAGQKGQISAKVMIDYDFENRVLHGNFEVFVNVAGGIIKGVGPGGRAGWAVLHFAPKEWYVYVGTPDDRVGVSVGIASIRATSTSYFMVGTKILGSPPPPPEVARILRMKPGELDYMGDLNTIGKGGGFAFGAALSINTGNLSFLMFYAKFEAGAGFDIMLKDYGDLKCKGSSSRIGINGWYANGQAYAYFEGAIGIRVRVFGRKKSIEILNIGAAAVMQAKLPNPFWMRGIVGGRFRVLGGLVRGNCKFQVTLGKECQLERDASAILDDIRIISELTPGNGETEVDVFNTPQALFNIPPNKTFELTDEIDNSKRSFRVALDHFKLLDGTRELTGTLEWNDNNDVVAFNSYEIFPSQKELKLVAQVSFEELKSGTWVPVISEGKRYTEITQHTFNSGIAPDYVPYQNVEFSYPVIGHANFYKDESGDGYIKLKKAMPDLFNPGPEWKQVGRATAADGKVSTFDFVYTYNTNRVTFKIPGDMRNNIIYNWELVNVPAQAKGSVDRNVSSVDTQVSVDGQDVDVQTSKKEAEGNIEALEEKQIYGSYLRTSSYATFGQKMDAFDHTRGWTWPISINVDELGTNLKGNEYFDKFELGAEQGKGLVQLEADLTENAWYRDVIYPITYQGYPIHGKGTISRNSNILGLPPVKAVYLRQYPVDMMITPENGAAGTANLATPSQASIIYNLAQEMYRDYVEIKNKCANLSVELFDEQVNRVILSDFPLTTPGDYKVKVKYILPGNTAPNTEKTKIINYTIDRGN